MKTDSRLHNSLLNLMSGFTYRFVVMISAFVVRTVFIRCLSSDYLGINGLYSNILSMLSLAELGFGTAMVYSMYQPLAQHDYHKLRLLMRLYRKVYTIVGSVVLILGLSVIPFLDRLMKDAPNVDGLTFYYLLFLVNTVISYWFFAYRNSILSADQKAYIVTAYSGVTNLVKSFLQIIVLIFFHNYAVYLITDILCTIVQNVLLAVRVKKMYPIFEQSGKDRLPVNETKRIFKDVQALMLSKIAHVILNSTDNIIISAFVGLKSVGLLSNYNMIIAAITGILSQITGAITASLGNYFAKEKREAGYLLFCRVDFLNFWLYGFSTIAFIILLNPFVTLWIGKEFTVNTSVIIAIAINFFVAGFMNALWVFRSTLGLFTQGRFRPLIVAILNIVLSIELSFVWGMTGVLVATFLSRALVNLWYDPWLIHKMGFEKSVSSFFKTYIIRLTLVSLVVFCMTLLSKYVVFIKGITITRFIVMTVLTAVIPNIVFVIAFHNTDEFRYFFSLFRSNIIEKINKKNI